MSPYYLSSRDASIVLYTVPPAVATLAVMLRGLARARSQTAFGWDDVFAVAAAVFFWASSAVSIWGTTASLHDTDPGATMRRVTSILTTLYINVQLTTATLSAAKLSILCLYKRIFGVNRAFNTAANVLIAISSAWWVTCSILGIFHCIPVSAAWLPRNMYGAKCYSLPTAVLITATINTVTEAAMVLLPIGMVHRLHLPTPQKMALGMVFALGFFVVVASIVRIVFVYSPTQGEASLLKSGLWGTIQMCTAICTACLPTYRSLFPRDWEMLKTVRRWYTHMTSRSRPTKRHDSSSDGEGHANVPSPLRSPLRHEPGKLMYETTAARGSQDRQHRDRLPSNAISVEHSISIA